MGYRIRMQRRPAEEIARVIQEQAARAHAAIEASALPPAERARQARVACKKIRAALRLLRNGDANTTKRLERPFRGAARGLSAVRDAGAVLATLERVRDEAVPGVKAHAFYVARRALAPDPRTIEAAQRRATMAFQTFTRALAAGVARVEQAAWLASLPTQHFTWAAPGFCTAYAQARRSFRKAHRQPTDGALHAWRKRVKVHAAHCALLNHTAPKTMRAGQEALQQLAALLGYERDLGLLRERLCVRLIAQEESEHKVRSLLRWIDARRQALRAEAFALGGAIFAEKPRVVTRRVRDRWHKAQRRAPHRREAAESRRPAIRRKVTR